MLSSVDESMQVASFVSPVNLKLCQPKFPDAIRSEPKYKRRVRALAYAHYVELGWGLPWLHHRDRICN